MDRAHRRAQGRLGRPRHPEAAGRRPSVRGARDSRPLARDQRQGHRRDRRRPAPDVGGAVLPPRLAAHAHHVRRARHDGLRAARGDRRQDGVPGRGCLGGRRRRRLPDDDVRDGDDSAGAAEGQRRDHQQRLPRHGPPVAGVLLRAPLRRDAAAQPGLRQARRRVRHRVARDYAPAGRHAGRSRPRARTADRSCSTSRSSRKTRCSRWSRPARISTR